MVVCYVFLYAVSWYFVLNEQLLTGKQRDVSSRNKATDPIIVNVSTDTFAVVNEKQCFLIQTECADPSKVEARDETTKKSAHLAVTWSDAPVSLGKLFVGNFKSMQAPKAER